MRRPFGEVLRAWLLMVPALLRVAVRRLRRARLSRATAPSPVSVETSAGTLSFEIGARCPLLLADQRIGTVTTHDDGGTSTAESVVVWEPESGRDVAVALVRAVAEASFARGNHRAAVWACEDDPDLVEALAVAGYLHEGRASPPWGDTRSWQMWARLSTDAD